MSWRNKHHFSKRKCHCLLRKPRLNECLMLFPESYLGMPYFPLPLKERLGRRQIIPGNGCPVLFHNLHRPTFLAFELVDVHLEWNPILNDVLRGAEIDKTGLTSHLKTFWSAVENRSTDHTCQCPQIRMRSQYLAPLVNGRNGPIQSFAGTSGLANIRSFASPI